MFIAIIVGGVFLLFAGLLFYRRNYFTSHGRKVIASVVGVERYVSKNKSRTSNKSQVFYRPLIKYVFNGDEYCFMGSVSSSSLDYKIGQQLKVYSLPQGPEYVVLVKSKLIYFILVFGIIGFSILIFAGHRILDSLDRSDPIELILQVTIPTLFFMFFIFMVHRRIGKINSQRAANNETPVSILDFCKTTIETQDSLERKQIFWTNEAIAEELKRHSKAGLIISLVFTIGSWLALYLFFYNLPVSKQNNYLDYATSPEKWREAITPLPPRLDNELVAICFLLFMSIICSYGLIYSINKRNQ